MLDADHMEATPFVYEEAFSRNLGLVTKTEQERLKNARIAIVGMGGVGGSHLLTLVRMGIGRFSLVDFDTFELPNFNRQMGASMASLGTSKVETMADMALKINPELDLRVQKTALTPETMDAFMAGVDVLVDGLDFFVPELRAQMFDYCHAHNIPFVTAGPMGLTTAWLVWRPKAMAPADYFRFDRAPSPEQKVLHFLLGISPKLLQKKHIVDMSSVDFKAHRGPSMAAACMAASAVAATEVLKLILGRGKIHALPWANQFDMLNHKTCHSYNAFGMNAPLNRLKLKILARKLGISLG